MKKLARIALDIARELESERDSSGLAPSPDQRRPADPKLLGHLGDRESAGMQLLGTIEIDLSTLVVAGLDTGPLYHQSDRASIETEQCTDVAKRQA